MTALRPDSSPDDPAQRLQGGLAALHLDLSAADITRLLALIALLVRWNAVHNLTAVRAPAEMVTRHLLDSLVALPWLASPGTALDIGTGAGFPGLPLAVVRPELSFTLLDVNIKKVTFVQHAIAALGLRNARAQRADIATFRLEALPDYVLARAFAPMGRLVSAVRHLCGPRTTILAWKGLADGAELDNLPSGFAVRARHPVQVPGLDAARTLIEVTRSTPA